MLRLPYRKHTRSLVGLIQAHVGSPSRGAEVGVDRGENSAALLTVFPYMTLYCVDPWENGTYDTTMPRTKDELVQVRLECFERLRPFVDRPVILWRDSDTASYMVLDGELDFCFIDGSHTYENVELDLARWARKVRVGGLLCGHDYEIHGRAAKKGFGVKRAVDEWASANSQPITVANGNIWWTVMR